MFNTTKKKPDVLTSVNIKRYINNGTLVVPDDITVIAEKAAFQKTHIKKVVIPSSVIEIGCKAFASSSIEKIFFEPRDSELTIKSYAFSNTQLKSIELPNNSILEDGVFEECKLLELVEIPLGVTKIPNYCFKNTSLKRVCFHNQIAEIGIEAFCNTEITELVIPKTIEFIDEKAFMDNDSLVEVKAENLRYIPEGAFSGCNYLENVRITYNEEFGLKLGSYAFANCYRFKGVEFKGDGYISVVEDSAFLNCHTLSEIDLSRTLIIGSNAFSDAKNLKDIGSLDCVRRIGRNAFFGCYNLNTVVLGENLLHLEAYAFFECKKLKEIELPVGLQKMEENVFESCINLQKVTIKAIKLEVLPAETFKNCKALKEVIILDNSEICKIERNCFTDCVALAKIEFPRMMQYIGEFAFSNCNSLNSIFIEGNSLIIENGAFSKCGRLNTVEIKGSIEHLKSAFIDCYILNTILIPFPNKIGEDFIRNCRNLTKIEFK